MFLAASCFHIKQTVSLFHFIHSSLLIFLNTFWCCVFTYCIRGMLYNLYTGVLKELCYQVHFCPSVCQHHPSSVSNLFMQQYTSGMYSTERYFMVKSTLGHTLSILYRSTVNSSQLVVMCKMYVTLVLSFTTVMHKICDNLINWTTALFIFPCFSL